jgi:Eukaryotic porin
VLPVLTSDLFTVLPTDYGLYKVEAKTKTSSGVEFTASGSSNHDTKNFLGNLETKYKWNEYG